MATFNFGERQSVESWGRGVQLSADGCPKAKAGGAEYDWTDTNVYTVAAGHELFLTDQLDENGDPQIDAVAIPAGTKVLPVGTPLERQTDGTFKIASGDVSAQRGEIYLVNETVTYVSATDHDAKALYPIAIDGGRVFKARIKSSTAANAAAGISGNVIGSVRDTTADTYADATISNLPTLAQILAALPGISLAQD